MTNSQADLGALLRSLDSVQLKVYVPRPVEIGLEDLVVDVMRQAPELGDVSRGDLVGALVQRAIETRDDLSGLVERYRNAKIHELLPSERRKRGPFDPPARARGRPARQP